MRGQRLWGGPWQEGEGREDGEKGERGRKGGANERGKMRSPVQVTMATPVATTSAEARCYTVGNIAWRWVGKLPMHRGGLE